MRTPRSTSRRAIRQALANSPSPYRARVAADSRPRSNASCASNCMRKAISSDAMRASSASSWPRCVQMLAVERLEQVELVALRRRGQVAVGDVADDPVRVDRRCCGCACPGRCRAGSCCSTTAGRRPACRDRARRSRAGSGSPCPGRRSATSPGSAGSAACCPSSSSSSDGSWFGLSVYIERSTQMSSMQPATCGKSSETSMPLSPCGCAANGEGINLPVLRRPVTTEAGGAWPAYLLQRRLGVEGIDVRRAAVHEQEDDPLRPRGEVRRPGGQRIRGDRRLRVADRSRVRRPGPAHELRRRPARCSGPGRRSRRRSGRTEPGGSSASRRASLAG